LPNATSVKGALPVPTTVNARQARPGGEAGRHGQGKVRMKPTRMAGARPDRFALTSGIGSVPGAYHSVGDPAIAGKGNSGNAWHQLARGVLQSATPRLTGSCLFAGLDPASTSHVMRLMNSPPIRLHRGDALYRKGSRFHALFAIRNGSCKSVLLTRDGNEQVAGYHIAGEIIGIDGIGTGTYECQASALEDMDVCRLAFDQVERLAQLSASFLHNLHKLMSLECARAQTLMVVLGTMRAEQRLAVFLLDLSRRYEARGFSSCEFVLRMTREEIGSYLGIALETVSRLFSRFQREGLIQVQGRTVKVLDKVAMNQLVDCETMMRKGLRAGPPDGPEATGAAREQMGWGPGE
jgi:CRP/FNR family transcriptional regulator